MKTLTADQFKYIINTMFNIACIKNPPEYEDLLLDKDWLYKYSWTDEQQSEFREWLSKYLALILKLTKTKALYTADLILLNYGFPVQQQTSVTDGD